MLRYFDALLEVLVYSVKTFVWFWHMVLTAFPRTEAFYLMMQLGRWFTNLLLQDVDLF